MERQSKNFLEKFLSLFTEVQAGEGSKSILLFFNIFLILTSYYIMKPVREALILAGGGAEIKSYASAGQALLMLGAVPAYAWLASRVNRRRLINTVTLIFMSCLGLFYALALTHVPIGVIFFLWIGVFNMMVPAQFWAFANDLHTPEAGKRLFVIFAFGASSGAVLGGIITDIMIEIVGVYQLLLVAGALLGLSLILTNIVDSRSTPVQKTDAKQLDEDTISDTGQGAFELVFRSRYLLAIAFLMMFLNWVNTTGEYILGRTVQDTATRSVSVNSAELTLGNQVNEDAIRSEVESYIGNFYAKFYTGVNTLGLLIQLFLVSRIFKYLGIRVALMVLPIIAFGGYMVMAFIPILSIIRWIKTAENATDYSLQNTVRHVLFLPTSREEKYKAKQAIDSFFVRAGDVLSAVLVYVGTTWLAFHTSQFALVCLGLVIIWLVLAVYIGIEHKKRIAAIEYG
ncbi:MFS transporter [candidate division KSB1 bacterium]|nr:MFS transporter [candidate division KSB1 bacterium]